MGDYTIGEGTYKEIEPYLLSTLEDTLESVERKSDLQLIGCIAVSDLVYSTSAKKLFMRSDCLLSQKKSSTRQVDVVTKHSRFDVDLHLSVLAEHFKGEGVRSTSERLRERNYLDQWENPVETGLLEVSSIDLVNESDEPEQSIFF